MKRQIRSSVFETNSSSQHSISILKKGDIYTEDEIMNDMYIHKDGTWNIYEGHLNFHRSPFQCLANFYWKFHYCIAALCYEYGDATWKELEAIAFKYIPGLTKIKLPKTTKSERAYNENNKDYGYGKGLTEDQLVEKLMEKEEQFNNEFELNYWINKDETYWYYDYPDTGYAEDYGMLRDFLDKKNISLEEFLTSSKFIVIVDGDEYCIWGDLKDSGVIDLNAIDYEYGSSDGVISDYSKEDEN